MNRSFPKCVIVVISLALGTASQSLAQDGLRPTTKKAAPRKAPATSKAATSDGTAGAAGLALFGVTSALGILLMLCVGAAILLAYFLPTFVAGMRHHPNTPAIAVLNVLLGWTFLGFVVALVWSFTAVPERRRRTRCRDDDELQAW